MNRAIRNISRRKIRALLVIIALGFSMAIMISIPAGVMANQEAAQALSDNLSMTINETGQSINQTLTQIDCSLADDFAGFGFRAPEAGNFTPGNMPMPPGSMGGNGFDPSQFGGGNRPGQFGGGSFGGGQANPMNETLYDDISLIDGVAAVAPILQASEGSNVTMNMMGRNFTRLVADYVIEGIPLTSDLVDNYPILPTNITEGRNLQAGDSGVVLLSENNTAFFGVGVGDTVAILGQSFTVIGVHGTSGVSDLTTLYMNLSDAQTVTNNTGYITILRVFTEDSSLVTQVANSISSLHTELTVSTAQQRLEQMQSLQSTYNTALENAEASLVQTQNTATEEIIVVVLATSLIVLFVMLYTVKERTKEIGTLKAIGFSNWTVMSQFMLEGVLLSVFAGVVGIVIGTILAPTLSSFLIPSISMFGTSGNGIAGNTTMQNAVTVSVNPQLMLIAFAVSITLGALGSLYPAWRAAKIRPAEAMRYE
jgi:ABC-type antimicrobial peptide transport system permease subunit